MSTPSTNVTIQIRYGNIEKTFTGDPEQVWLAVNKFFSEFLPSFEIAQKLTLNVDLQKLAKECEGIIAFSPEGANLLVARDKLTDNETLASWLLACYVGFRLGMMESEAVSKEYLQAKLGKDAKIASTRLGELVKTDIAARTTDDKYKMTTFGVVQTQKEILPRIRAKIG